jgi:hypothetical protein
VKAYDGAEVQGTLLCSCHCSYGQGPPDVRDQNLMLSQVGYEVLTSIEMQGE